MARASRKASTTRKRTTSTGGRKGQTTSKAKGSAKKAAAPPTRPPEVTAEQWAKWSPSYRKRAAGFYKKHPGAPSYRMRGKGKGEHLTRKARLQARVEAFGKRLAKRKGTDAGTEIARLEKAVASPRGEGWFGKYERLIAARYAEWTAAGSPRKGAPKALGYSLDAMMDDLDDEGVDWEWDTDDLFYH